MARATVFLITLMFVLPFDGSSQAVPSPGDRIRIRQVDGTVLTGTLARLSAEAIQLSVDSSRAEGPFAIPRSRIASQQGTRNKSTPVGIVGLLAGGVIAWATLGDKESRSCDGGFGVDVGCEVAADIEAVENAAGDAVRVLLGMAVGGVVGALVGSALRTENWAIVPLIEVGPTGQGTSASVFGFGLRFVRVRWPW